MILNKQIISSIKNIFLADDDQDDQTFFVDALGDIDPEISCQVVNDGQTALTTLRNLNELPSIIFLDINMPYLNGLDCLVHLRADSRFDKIPIVILTTSSTGSQRARDLGANMYLTKPTSIKELTCMLQNTLINLFDANNI